VGLGRKNHLFAGSDGGAEREATVCSLIASAKLNDVEPFTYLNDLLQRMTEDSPMSRLMNCRRGIGLNTRQALISCDPGKPAEP
jgi:IS66 C-terminal element